MCCFSGVVSHVAETQIFARPSGDAQILVYSMKILAAQEVAMILPLPVPPQSPENAVRFINMEAYPEFFQDLEVLFPAHRAFGGIDPDEELALSRAPLAIQEVGQFEASFVPAIADFARLDPRFRLPATAWQELPQYRDWGFAVFKLKQPHAAPLQPAKGVARSLVHRLFGGDPAAEAAAAPDAPEPHRVHPMAFEFPRRDPKQLFFPTVHIHDGQVHAEAAFDHMLYFQLDRMFTDINFPGHCTHSIVERWASLDLYFKNILDRTPRRIAQRMDLRRSAGTLLPDVPIYRCSLAGPLPNQDAILGT